MELNNTQELFKRKRVGKLIIDSKKNNYKISSINISPYLPNKKEIDRFDEKTKKFFNIMLKYFSYEIIYNSTIKLYFDFDACKEELGIDVNKDLPIPYLIKIDIIDEEKIEAKKCLHLITEKITNYKNKIFDIILKKVSFTYNEVFVIVKSDFFYSDYYIVHKYEEDWKKFCLYKHQKEAG